MSGKFVLVLTLFLAGRLIGSVPFSSVYADCPDGTSNPDTISCSGIDDTDPGSDALAGNDNVTVETGATVDGNVNGDAGNDTVTVQEHGTVNGDLNGGDGDDSLTNDGDVNHMNGDGGDDTLV